MLDFTKITKKILQQESLLNEMPVQVTSRDHWIDAMVNLIVYNKGSGDDKGDFAIHSNVGGDKGGLHSGSRGYIDTIAADISLALITGRKKAFPNSVLNKNDYTQENIYKIINDSKIKDIDEQVKNKLVDSIFNAVEIKRKDILQSETFARQITIDIADLLFDIIFKDNTPLQSTINIAHKYNNRGEEVEWPHINFSNNEEEFKMQILNALNNSVLPTICKSYGIKYIPNRNNLDKTAHFIHQARSAFISDWPTKLKDFRKTL
jgi:hypothetical protein